MIRCLGAVWAEPDLHGCKSPTLGVEVGLAMGVIFGMAVGVETGQQDLVLGSQVQLIVVLIEWLWQTVAHVWETWYKPVLIWPRAQHHCI